MVTEAVDWRDAISKTLDLWAIDTRDNDHDEGLPTFYKSFFYKFKGMTNFALPEHDGHYFTLYFNFQVITSSKRHLF